MLSLSSNRLTKLPSTFLQLRLSTFKYLYLDPTLISIQWIKQCLAFEAKRIGWLATKEQLDLEITTIMACARYLSTKSDLQQFTDFDDIEELLMDQVRNHRKPISAFTKPARPQ